MSNWLKETTLEGQLVKLVPLQKQHRNDLIAASNEGELWKLWYTFVPGEHNIDNYINTVLEDARHDKALPFVVILKENNKVIGSTRFCNATPPHRRLELGYTWYSKSYQRTGVNSECKYLLLTHAFEVLNCIAVEFRTHWHNLPSRTAIAKLGAKQDGVLRNHQIDNEGALRDTVVFSILRDEWAVVKRSLKFRMEQNRI